MRGSGVSPGGLLEDELVQGEIRDRSAQPRVFSLKLLQALGLRDVQAPVLLAPVLAADLAYANRPCHLGYLLALAEQNVGLAQLGDDLLGAVLLRGHDLTPLMRSVTITSGWTGFWGVRSSVCLHRSPCHAHRGRTSGIRRTSSLTRLGRDPSYGPTTSSRPAQLHPSRWGTAGQQEETHHGHPTRAHDKVSVANTMPSVALSVPSALMT